MPFLYGLALDPWRQVIGFGIQLPCNMIQASGDIRSARHDAPKFDSGHSQKCGDLLEGAAGIVFYRGAFRTLRPCRHGICAIYGMIGLRHLGT